MDREVSSKDSVHPPNPLEFDKFLPWACKQLQLNVCVVISRSQQQEYTSTNTSERTKSKTKCKAKALSQARLSSKLNQESQDWECGNEIVIIQTFYDHNDNLVQIKFNKNKRIPRVIFKVIGLIIKYHRLLTSIMINSGIDNYTIHELCRFLPLSNITDVCLDGTYLKNVNYEILLEQENFIRNLSLSRCGIDDFAVSLIAGALKYPLPASKSLSILNLSSNRISDEGVQSIANALRSNRQLSYLNLADNMISDLGVTAILNTLTSFPLSIPELSAFKSRHMAYLKDKADRIALLVKELQSSEVDKRPTKPKSAKTPTKKKMYKEMSLKTLHESVPSSSEVLLEKAKAMVEATLGPFNDPFNKTNTFIENSYTYCYGNNSLCCLNLSYNNLTYITLKNLTNVLLYQKKMFRKPRGLLKISIDGNFLPTFCKELHLIDCLLDDCLSTVQRGTLVTKKKTLIKQNK